MAWRLMQYKGAFDALMADCDQEMKDALAPRLIRVAQLGNQAKPPITESLGDGLFEIRARAKKVRIRLLFGYLPQYRVVVVWAGTKDQRRLSPATIRAARALLVEAAATIELLENVVIH